ncbi:MAG: hypothetical protein HRT35_27865 [Algicola sp.]|nr:hypothetical protein [Algicola sp.]
MLNYRLMKLIDFDPVLDLLADMFAAHAPMELALGITADQFRTMAEFEMAPLIKEGLSVVAHDPDDGTLVAVIIAQDAATPEPEGPSPTTSKYRPIGQLINPLHHACLERFSRYNGKLHYMFVVGIRTEYQGRGLLKTLTNETLKVAAKRGFEQSFAIATTQGAHHSLQRLGFEMTAQTQYQDFVYQGQRPFLSIADHGGATVMVRACAIGR